ncbi:ComEC/Rec2 family competence protein [Aestuariivirga sp.]|uniref:ComEC/Rec2 family competence protein n=1 Tax=Aestuariivirga sp. TaxID=2650926 RepID=UPI0035938FEE
MGQPSTAGVLDNGIADDHAPSGLRVRHWLEAAFARQQGRLFLWCPAALALGIWIYFGLPGEPSLYVAAAIATAAAMLLWFGRNSSLAILVALVAAGFVLAKARNDIVAAPLLGATTGEVAVTGRVVSVERAARKRMVIILAPDNIEGLQPDRIPERLRLSGFAKLGQPLIGSRVSFKARLSPLPTPVQPGGFDYGRKLWFDSVGGTGRITTPITTLDASVPLRARLDATLSGIRATMGARIHAALEEPYASFAEALITGERSTIPKELNQSLLVSGLFHILSISGLHMWLVAGGVFWTVRAGLALVPVLALRYPIKKWAAAAALAMGLFYMMLADSGVATQRSFVMIAVVFFAVMVDRPAISVRNLAIAALLVLVLEPEAAVEASFQMSFLAVLGLAAFYETWARFRAGGEGDTRDRHWALRIMFWLLAATAASLLTSLVAGVGSTIPAAYHFGRVSPYSLVANGLAIPVIGLVVMPFALLSAVLMPFGLEAWPLMVVAKGLELVIAISNHVAGLPGADSVMSQPSAASVMFIGVGTIVLCLLAGPVRLVGLAVAGVGGLLLLLPPPAPDILIERAGANVALRDPEGRLVPTFPNRARFTVEKWLQVNGEEAKPAEAAKRPAWTCKENRCTAMVKGRRITYVTRAEGKPVDCSGTDILITDFPLRGGCRTVAARIDRFDLWKSGAHALRIGPEGLSIETARAAQGNRPWVVKPERRATPYIPRPPKLDVSPD